MYTYPATKTSANLSINNNVVYTTGSHYTMTTTASGTGTNLYTISDSNWSTTPITMNPAGRIDLKGDSADVVINGESLREVLTEMRAFLRLPPAVQRDHKLEQEYQELLELGKQYQERVAHYREQRKIFDILKKNDS
jgi:hypothetical protein